MQKYTISDPESIENSTSESLGWLGRTSLYCRDQVDDIIEFEYKTPPTRQCVGSKVSVLPRLVEDPIADLETIWQAEADAIRRANEISSDAAKIPIVWYNYHAEFYDVDPCVPSWDRLYTGDEVRDVSPSRGQSRSDALALVVKDGWAKYTHIGNVPSTREQMHFANEERYSNPLAPSVKVEDKQG